MRDVREGRGEDFTTNSSGDTIGGEGGEGLRRVQSQVSAPTSMGGEGPMSAINTRGHLKNASAFI